MRGSDRDWVRRCRVMALVEGGSLLVLVFLAMPLKYFAEMPQAVQVVGWIHGILFLVFCALLAVVFFRVGWSFWRAAFVFAAAWVPFGPFLIDGRMRRYEKEARNQDSDPPALGEVEPG